LLLTDDILRRCLIVFFRLILRDWCSVIYNWQKWKAGKRTAERDRYHGGRFFQTVVAPSKPLNARFV